MIPLDAGWIDGIVSRKHHRWPFALKADDDAEHDGGEREAAREDRPDHAGKGRGIPRQGGPDGLGVERRPSPIEQEREDGGNLRTTPDAAEYQRLPPARPAPGS